MLKSSGAMGAATLTSRLLGFAREVAYSHFMGATLAASAFQYAFSIPNLFRRLLGEGVLSAAFIPIFKAKEKNEGEAAMWQASNAVVSGLIVATTVICALVMLGISVFLKAGHPDPKWRLMLELLRVMFPYVILVCVAAVCMGILNARGFFFIPAMGASALNVVMIASVFFLAPRLGETLDQQIFALAIGVLVAGLAQAAFQWPSLRATGFRYRWVAPWTDPTVREVVAKMIIGSIGVAAFQINVLATQTMAFGANDHIIAVFSYATRLMELPQGVFGISLATYLLTTLSGLAVEKKYDEFRSTLRQGVSYLLFTNFVASVFLVALAEPIIRLVFEHGKFNSEDTVIASEALICLAPGLVAFSLVNIFARAFYALDDIKTPMKISVFCLSVNLLLTAFFLYALRLDAAGLALANTFTSFMNAGLLAFTLRKKLKRLDLDGTLRDAWPVAAAGLAAGVLAWVAQWQWNRHIGHAGLPARIGHVFVPLIPAAALYFGVVWKCKVQAARDVTDFALSRFKRKAASPK